MLFMSGGPDSKLWSRESGFQSPLPAPNLTLFLTASLLVFRVTNKDLCVRYYSSHNLLFCEGTYFFFKLAVAKHFEHYVATAD